MSVSRIPCRVGLLAAVLLALPGIGKAQEQLAQPASWCLRWTDNCTTCDRRRNSGEISCAPTRGARPNCMTGRTRCVMEDIAALKAACESSKTIREACNVCPPPGRPQLCTLKACAVKEIVCVKPRT